MWTSSALHDIQKRVQTTELHDRPTIYIAAVHLCLSTLVYITFGCLKLCSIPSLLLNIRITFREEQRRDINTNDVTE